jgi:hypothetical protein
MADQAYPLTEICITVGDESGRKKLCVGFVGEGKAVVSRTDE